MSEQTYYWIEIKSMPGGSQLLDRPYPTKLDAAIAVLRLQKFLPSASYTVREVPAMQESNNAD